MTGREARAKLQSLIDARRGAGGGDLAERVRFELSHAPRTWHLPQPTVEVQGGTAILRGVVPHETGRLDLERTAAAVAGVVEVDNHVAISASGNQRRPLRRPRRSRRATGPGEGRGGSQMADESGTTSSDEVTLESATLVKAPRRRALWGVLAVVAVAAGALAITAGGDDASLPTLPVALGSAGRDSAAGVAAPEAADMKMMAWVTYVAGEDLPALGGEGPAYRLAGSVDEAQVQALADALGVAGDPVHQDGYWHLQSGDAVLEVYEGGGGTWWYSIQQYEILPAEGGGSAGCEPGPAVDCGIVAPDTPVAPDAPVTTVVQRQDCAEGEKCIYDPGSSNASCSAYQAADGTTVEECSGSGVACPPDVDCPMPLPTPIEPQPPADLPSEPDAREIALDLLRATGMDVDDAIVTVDGPYDAWYVTVEPKLDGVPVSGWMSSVSVGSKGTITNASGTLASPELIGDYPLIDTRAAIDRLNEQQGDWFAYDDVRPLGAPGTASSSSGVTTAEAPAIDVGAPTTVAECTTSPDGAETCTGAAEPAPPTDCVDPALADPAAGVETSGVCAGPLCNYAPPTGGEPATTVPECGPYAEPEPIEIVLDDADRVLVLLPAVDDSGDSYLLSGYRFSGDDGAIAEIAAVADESLAPTTTVPVLETTLPPGPAVDPAVLEPGQAPVIGVGYYVDVDVACAAFELGGEIWRHDVGDLAGWSTPHEGGTFTLDGPAHGTFVGDAAAEKAATFVTGTDPEGCTPTPRT